MLIFIVIILLAVIIIYLLYKDYVNEEEITLLKIYIKDIEKYIFDRDFRKTKRK